MTIKDMPETERPREKMLSKGVSSLSNAELIAAIIGSGTRDKDAVSVARNLLSLSSSGLGYLGRCSAAELSGFPGIGKAKACQIAAAAELGRRLAACSVTERELFGELEDIAVYFVGTMRYFEEERFHIMLLDAHGRMISVEEISRGGLMSAQVHPREVFAPAIKARAAAIVAAHNHPSGDCKPGREDIEATERLVSAGEILGIPLCEHYVIGDGTYSGIRMNNRA